MSNGRNSRRNVDAGRDTGSFIALPWSVMDSAAYVGLSYPARALLLEIARQFVRDNNGRLLASRAHLLSRGWKSADVIHRAKNELQQAGFIYETVKGHRPNKASWYAVTWRMLDRHPGYDPGAVEGFVRGAYRAQPKLRNASPSPLSGTGKHSVGPPAGQGEGWSVPGAGPMRATAAALSVP